jgi:hypothetical protein
MLDWSDPSVASPDSISPSEGEPRARYHGDHPLIIKISINDWSILSPRHQPAEAAVLLRSVLHAARFFRADGSVSLDRDWILTYDSKEKNLGAISAKTTDRFTIICAIISLAWTCTRSTAR